jgi:hypothetical protein
MKNGLSTFKLALILSVLVLGGCAPALAGNLETQTMPLAQPSTITATQVAVTTSEPIVRISPTSGVSGTLVQVVASGFPANTPIAIALGPANSEFSQVAQGVTDSNGSFIAQVPVAGAPGMGLFFAALAEGQSGVLAPDQFQVVAVTGTNPVVNIAPTSGPSGTVVYITATGFPANMPFSVLLGPANSEFSQVAQGVSDANGVILAQVPALGEPGMNLVFAVMPEGQPGILSPEQFQIVNVNVSTPAVRISPTSGASGTLVHVVASGFPSNTPVWVGLGPVNSEFGQVAQGVTDSNGSFTAQVPALGEPGTNLVFAAMAEGQPGVLSPDQFQVIFAVPNPSPLTATPTPYMDTWTTFSSPAFAVSLQYPADWQPAGYGSPETGEIRFAGINGFFHINSMDGDSIDSVAAAEAGHRLQPYGSHPTIETLQIQGQEARLILPSSDQPYQAALIVRYPPVLTIVWSPRYFVLWADPPHIRAIAETLRFTN